MKLTKVMGGADPTLRSGLEAMLARAIGRPERVRLHMLPTASDPREGRVIEGHVLEIAVGRDKRKRLRIGIPAGRGDPVEVRVLLDGIERVETIDEGDGPAAQPSSSFPAVRRPTLSFGADRAITPPNGALATAANDGPARGAKR